MNLRYYLLSSSQTLASADNLAYELLSDLDTTQRSRTPSAMQRASWIIESVT